MENSIPAAKTVGMIAFDHSTLTFHITAKQTTVSYRYHQIVSFELLEDGKCMVKGGIGYPPVGIAADTMQAQGRCSSLHIKITLGGEPPKSEVLSYITTATTRGSFIYKSAYENAQEALDALQLAFDTVHFTDTETPGSILPRARQLLKYKTLLDGSIISEEAFCVKKKQLLGL